MRLTHDRRYRIEKVRRRYARGFTVKEIAAALEVKEKEIQKDLKLLNGEAETLLKETTSKHAARIWERYEELYRSAWEAFAASQGDVVVTTIRSDEMDEETDADGKKRQVPKNPKSQIVRKKSAGDPRFHAQAMDALDRLAEMCGVLHRRGTPGKDDTAPAVGSSGLIVRMPVNGRDMHLQGDSLPENN